MIAEIGQSLRALLRRACPHRLGLPEASGLLAVALVLGGTSMLYAQCGRFPDQTSCWSYGENPCAVPCEPDSGPCSSYPMAQIIRVSVQGDCAMMGNLGR